MPATDPYQPTCIACNSGVQVYRKRSRTITLLITDPDDVFGDLTGSKLWMMVKESVDDLDVAALITKLSANNGGADSQAKVTVATGIDPATSAARDKEVEFYIDPVDTEPLDPGDFSFDAAIELPSGALLELLPPSKFEVTLPITRT